MEKGICIEPKVDGESVEISKDAIIEVLSTVGSYRFSDDVAIQALSVLGKSATVSADYMTISNNSFNG